MRRNVSLPAAWPALRGRPRFLAQRPLPSMMIAMCRGTGRSPPAPVSFLKSAMFPRASL